jgi:hypothetical protein
LAREVDLVSLDPAVWGTVFPDLVNRPRRAILGFRVNRIQLTGWPKKRRLMMSLGGWDYCWQAGINTARCLRHQMGARHVARFREEDSTHHIAPASGCGCGFYAFHNLATLASMFQLRPPWNECVLIGVAGSGIIKIHELGWRAQFARIVAFSDGMPRLVDQGVGFEPRANAWGELDVSTARALEASYRVPVVPLAKLRDVMLESGNFVEGIP